MSIEREASGIWTHLFFMEHCARIRESDNSRFDKVERILYKL